MSKGINVLSLFDGMSTGRLALDNVGINVENYFSCEIQDAAIAIADYNFPQDSENRLGDVRAVKGSDLPKIDLLIGGSPCQDLSNANNERSGLTGVKSSLFFEYLRLFIECKPKYFLLENVSMTKQNQDLISFLLCVKPVEINSSLVSAQLRKRLYWTNINFDIPDDKGVTLSDIIAYGYTPRDKARCVLTSDSRQLSTPSKIFHRSFKFNTPIFKSKEHYDACMKHYKDNGFKTAKDIDNFKGDLSVYDGIRYMLRSEFEALQTLPTDYTYPVPYNQAIHCIGDGWTLEIIEGIFKGLLS